MPSCKLDPKGRKNSKELDKVEGQCSDKEDNDDNENDEDEEVEEEDDDHMDESDAKD